MINQIYRIEFYLNWSKNDPHCLHTFILNCFSSLIRLVYTTIHFWLQQLNKFKLKLKHKLKLKLKLQPQIRCKQPKLIQIIVSR